MAEAPHLRNVLEKHAQADVVGSVYEARATWQALNPPQEVWETVSGLPIRTSRRPASHRRTTVDSPEMAREIEQLIAMGAVIRTQERPEVVTPIFGVPKRLEDALRLIHDLRRVNETLESKHFTMKGLGELELTVTQGDWMIAIDLRKGYYQILVRPEDRSKLGFEWRGRFYVFKVMPFGLSTAPRAYVQMVRFFTKWLRKTFSIKVVAYLDDWVLMHKDRAYLTSIVTRILQAMLSFGLIVGENKCVLSPSQRLDYLGVTVDSSSMTFTLTEAKRSGYLDLIDKTIKNRRTLTHQWSSLIGKLNFCRTVMGDTALVRVKTLQRQRNKAVRDKKIRINRESIYNETMRDLEWWKVQLQTAPSRCFEHRSTSVRIESDASHEGLAAIIFSKEKTVRWSTDTHRLGHLHITSLETLAIVRAIMANREMLKGERIRVLTDSTTAARWVRTSAMPACSMVEMEIKQMHDWLAASGTSLITFYLPGRMNWTADSLSRPTTFKPLEWATPDTLLLKIAARWGALEGDLFSAPGSTLRPTDASIRTDAFSREWRGRLLATPPHALLSRVVQRLEATHVQSRKSPWLQHSAVALVFADTGSNQALQIREMAQETIQERTHISELEGSELAKLAGRAHSVELVAAWIPTGT